MSGYLSQSGSIEIAKELPAPIREILSQACEIFCVRPVDVLWGSHSQSVVAARRLAIVQIRRRGHSSNEIGRFLNLHHSSVLYHLKAARAEAAS